MKAIYLAIGSATLSTVCAAATAEAQEASAQYGRAAIEPSFWTGGSGGSATILSPMLRASFPIGDRFGVSADWGFVLLSVSPDRGESEARFKVGNPFIAAHYLS